MDDNTLVDSNENEKSSADLARSDHHLVQKWRYMEPNRKTVIVTGASQGIGAGIVQAFLERATML